MKIDLKALKPFGVILILVLSVLFVIACFTLDMKVPEKYESLHDTEYYKSSRENMEELLAELEANVFPKLDGVEDAYVEERAGQSEKQSVDAENTADDHTADDYVIVIEAQKFKGDKIEAVLQRDFDPTLFDVQEKE